MGRPRKIVTETLAAVPPVRARKKRGSGGVFRDALKQAKTQLKSAQVEAEHSGAALQRLQAEIPRLRQTVYALEHQLEVKRAAKKKRVVGLWGTNVGIQEGDAFYSMQHTPAEPIAAPIGETISEPETMAGVVLPAVYQGGDWK